MHTDYTLDFLLSHWAVIPSYSSVFQHKPRTRELLRIVRKYPVVEWLSYLSRLQTMLAANRTGQDEWMEKAFAGVVGPSVQRALIEFAKNLPKKCAAKLFYERQLSTLQQFAVVHAPKVGSRTFEQLDQRDDLGKALLMTYDVMNARRHLPKSPQTLLAHMVQDQIRMSPYPPAVYAGRAMQLYELNKRVPSHDTRTYLNLFATATRCKPRDFIFGGLAVTAHEEANLRRDVASGWAPLPWCTWKESRSEAACLRTYGRVRCGSTKILRQAVRDAEQARVVRDWNLIGLSQVPLIHLGGRDKFVLNLTAVGRSLFDGIRHAILTAARRSRLSRQYNSIRAVEGLYGHLFERFVHEVLERAFSGRVIKVPTSTEDRADFIILFPSCVIALETKARHFIASTHAAYMPLGERRKELEKIGLRKAVKQLVGTIKSMRRDEVDLGGMNYRWATTPIVPIVVTEEELPQLPKSWEHLFRAAAEPLERMANAGPIAKLRFLSVNDIEILPDLVMPDDFGRTCLKWANHDVLFELPLKSYLVGTGISWQNGFICDRYAEVMTLLARRLGLDVSKLTFATHRVTRTAENR